MTTTAMPGPLLGQVDVFFTGDWHHHPDRAAQSDEALAAGLQGLQRQRARDAAEEAELVLALAARRSAALDPPPDAAGSRRAGWGGGLVSDEISEFFPAELATVLNVGRGTASLKLARALTWSRKLPATLAALAAGEIDERRACALADTLAHTNAEVAGQVEAALLPQATGLSVYKLTDRATALMLQLDAAAADQRRAEAEKTADVRVHPSATDGHSTLAADLPTDEAVECHDLLDQLAAMLKADGDPRPIGALRAHVLSTLIRRPADTGLPHVAAHLTVTAELQSLTGAATVPGEVNGLPITAAHLRELLVRIGALGLTAPDGGTLTFAITGPHGELLATATPAELARLANRGCAAHPSSACTCSLLGPPPPTTAYTPTDRQRAFLTIRDRRCRFPNCGQRAGWTDLDHVQPHGDGPTQGGATDCANLCCLCRSHHRLKTFAPGWHFRLDPDGTLHVTTPSGVTRTTSPPGQHPPGQHPPGQHPPGQHPPGEHPPGEHPPPPPPPIRTADPRPGPPADDPPF